MARGGDGERRARGAALRAGAPAHLDLERLAGALGDGERLDVEGVRRVRLGESGEVNHERAVGEAEADGVVRHAASTRHQTHSLARRPFGQNGGADAIERARVERVGAADAADADQRAERDRGGQEREIP